MSGRSGWQAAAALWYRPGCTDITADILGFATYPRPPGRLMAVVASAATCPPPACALSPCQSQRCASRDCAGPPPPPPPALAGPIIPHHMTHPTYQRSAQTPHCRSLSGPHLLATPPFIRWPRRERRKAVHTVNLITQKPVKKKKHLCSTAASGKWKQREKLYKESRKIREIHSGPSSSFLLGHCPASSASSLHPFPTHPRAL